MSDIDHDSEAADGRETAGSESTPVRELPPGPRDISEVDVSKGYVDLGSLLVPAVEGLQLRADLADDKKTVRRILLVLGSSGLQIQLAAAPKSGGVWDEVREGLKMGFATQGADVSEEKGRYGTELRAVVPMSMPDGTKGTTPMRVIGREGPRWFARIDVIGQASLDEQAWGPLQDVLDRIVVRRGDEPRPRLDLLPMTLPNGATEVPSV